MSETIVVKYQTINHYCSCCYQKLPEAETSKVREFKISKEDVMGWANWKDVVEYPDDMKSMVSEFVYETIRFWAILDSNVKLIIKDGEVERVKELILCEVIQ